MSDIPSFPYEILWGERHVRSVANLTRLDGEEFLPARPRGAGADGDPGLSARRSQSALDDMRAAVGFVGAAVLTSAAGRHAGRVAPAAPTGRGTEQMPDVTVKRVEDFEAIFGGGFRRVRAGLGVTSFGLAVMDLPPNFKLYPEHDQTTTTRRRSTRVLSGRVDARGGGRGSRARARRLRAGRERPRSASWSRATSPPGPRDGGDPGRIYEPPEFTDEGAPRHRCRSWSVERRRRRRS